jgi:hypothetical protein
MGVDVPPAVSNADARETQISRAFIAEESGIL